MNDYDLENQSCGRDCSSRLRSANLLIGTGISEPSLLNTCCNVRSVATKTRPWICPSDLMRSAQRCSMRRWTLSGYMALIRSTSLTRSKVRLHLRDLYSAPWTKSRRRERFRTRQMSKETMTAAIYFGEMLVASLLAIVLLAISQLRMSSDAALFVAGVVVWTLPNILLIALCCIISYQSNMAFITPTPTRRSSQYFGRYGSVSRWSI